MCNTTYMKINRIELDGLVKDHYLTRRVHPTEELYIYNYTPKTQYDKVWNEYTLMCRGLIVDKDYNIVARPFRKFFNLEEYQGALPDGEFKFYDKLDGSLGILYWVGNEAYLATRGSFDSDQAIKGTELLKKYDLTNLDRKYTYLFEIIYPENRIVIDYGKDEKLILLAIIETETGLELPLQSDIFETAKLYEGLDMNSAKLAQEDNKEGFVIRWDNGFRLKFKFEEYVRLHRLITGCTARSIWNLLQSGQPFDELLNRVPDEFFNWVKEKLQYFKDSFLEKKNESLMFFRAHDLQDMTRKDAALLILDKNKDLAPILFKMLDGRPYEKVIWDMLYPQHEIPFKTEI